MHATVHGGNDIKTVSVRGIEIDITRLILLWIMVHAMPFYETLNKFLQEDS